MNRHALGAGALILAATQAGAGALDRSGQPVGAIFEQGRRAELSFGVTEPGVKGTFPGTGASSGDVGERFPTSVLSLREDITDRLSYAIIVDQPFGADVDYGDADPTYPIAGSEARFRSTGVTLLGRYRLGDRLSVHGGLRLVRVDADLRVRSFNPGLGAFTTYEASFEPDEAVGYVLGAAYERPEIALRVALTYSSETRFAHGTDYVLGAEPGGVPVALGGGSGTTAYTLPQSVNLDAQTGIAPGTLLFGSVRWVDWSETRIDTPGYPGNPVVAYAGDYVTYTLGVGREITDRLSGSVAVIYERGVGEPFDPAVPNDTGASNLGPTDGQLGIQLGARYELTEALEVGAALRVTRLGGATTRGIGAVFEDNEAASVGVRVAYRF